MNIPDTLHGYVAASASKASVFEGLPGPRVRRMAPAGRTLSRGCHGTTLEAPPGPARTGVCGTRRAPADAPAAQERGREEAMRGIAGALAALCLTVGAAQAADILGAGATFPYPVYAKWAEAYRPQTVNGPNSQLIGSGVAIKQIKWDPVTFGTSDKPLEQKELEEA